jgi:hypothetical protein
MSYERSGVGGPHSLQAGIGFALLDLEVGHSRYSRSPLLRWRVKEPSLLSVPS